MISSVRPAMAPRRPLAVSAAQQPAPLGTPINGGPPASSRGPLPAPSIFANIESMIQATFSSSQPGQRSDWREVEGAYVLFPPAGRPPAAVAHFLGGAFVGAAPQMAYRLFLEALANRDILVVATPYSTSFDHLRIADEAQFKFDRAMRALAPQLPPVSLPTYGVGHSLGALIHLLISARYAVQRSGNVLLSFNNRPASDVIPLLSPLIVPSARLLGPLINQLAASPLRSTVEATAPLEELSRGVVGISSMLGGQVGGPVTDGMQSLADEVAAWCGSGAVAMSGTRALPAAALGYGSGSAYGNGGPYGSGGNGNGAYGSGGYNAGGSPL
ncbi:hypothetical protein GPECTOR_149g30 [Gonium pectorale]|uniref:Uncharacterized protein n=1 Tax=Gonium pectorale TaxID=33097 RepID=A0A150FZD3_GONPE|nr:hypothetical protein GPECTOR_149g30 [Gonium pectorale]|eukprot:KXZ42420.1 hypothetical protein GPECTOR_149g30 [Gonium pectorale]